MKYLALTLAVLACPTLAYAGPADVSGMWQTEEGGAHISIADCGDGTPCGTLVWVEMENASAQTDGNNPDAELRTKPLLGLKMLWGFKPKKEGWKSGKIYDPESGKIYGSKLKLGENGILNVKGCIGPICQTQKWSRVPQTGSATAATD